MLPLNIALFAGEHSGDVQGAALAAALRERWSGAEARGDGTALDCPACDACPLPTKHSSLSLWGIGGMKMREAGVQLRFELHSLGCDRDL